MLEKLKELIKNIDEEVDTESLNEDSRLIEDVKMTSITFLYMAVAIEEEFGVDLANADFSQIKTIGDVMKIIKESMPQ